ncbi:MAG: nucleotidyl transferase AbiEii/AbiGii toxin family protein [Acidobacteria bacterium]|nr:nucleotidyl transferase AbiEii/AbiGii toxin family protein [Acidobacteriota bacterium]
MKRPLRNVAASVRERISRIAAERNESYDYVLSLYGRERFLFRLSKSAYRERLVLKGAMVLSLWVEELHRTTRDLDFLGYGELAPEDVSRILGEVCEAQVPDDGLRFDRSSISAEVIRSADEYKGVRARFSAHLDSALIRLQVDIGVGDVITPGPEVVSFPTLLDMESPQLQVYPTETIVAEKLHAIVHLGMGNSRMKDFFDLYTLSSDVKFDLGVLQEAVKKTFARRRTDLPLDEPVGLSPEFFSDVRKRQQWVAFLKKIGAVEILDFESVGARLRTFLTPVLAAAASGKTARGAWSTEGWDQGE